MSGKDFASIFGRHEFLIRRLHSLTGLFPIGGYLVFHLATNAAIIDGIEAYQHRADQIHQLGETTILFLEWPLIFLPILFHGLVGLVIVTRGKRNVAHYPYLGNVRYTLQRVTGVIALLFILWHVSQMHGWFRWEWWVENVARPLGGAKFDPQHAITAAQVIQSSWLYILFYAVGTIASVYHLANGLWTMGITWGLWTSPRAQRAANVPCALVGLFLLIVGLGALVGMMRVEVSAVRGNAAVEHTAVLAGRVSPRWGLERSVALLRTQAYQPGLSSVGLSGRSAWADVAELTSHEYWLSGVGLAGRGAEEADLW